MSVEALKARLPDTARDLRINLGVIAGSTALTPAQAWTVALASAIAARNAGVIAAVTADAPLSPEAVAGAHAAASIMAMTTVYYRFLHFTGDDYAGMPARLRMQVIGKPGIDHLDFELACLAASAIAGCERCVVSHEQSVRERGGTKEAIQDAVRIASVIHAVAVTLDAGGSAPVAVAA